MDAQIGVDVGGTNTDAVAMAQGRCVVAAAKTATTRDVTTGVRRAISTLLQNIPATVTVSRVHIGTTHFLNAVIERRHLERVSVIRLCGPATLSLPPFTDFPTDLKEVICGTVHLLDGGFQFDGQTPIKPVNEREVIQCIGEIKAAGVKNIVVAGVFAPINTQQEEHVLSLIHDYYKEASVTLSHKVGHVGLLERENAAILNESLKTLCRSTVSAFQEALRQLGLDCPLYLTQNDGTLLSAEQTLELPIHTFASGPTNSMRGAAFLSDESDAIVVDIGGTSTDVGVLVKGFPREASTQVKVGGVRTNFRMPDVLCIGLGGGSHVQGHNSTDNKVEVGPQSVGYRLTRDATVFGGDVITASDVAVAAGLTVMGQPDRVTHLPATFVSSVVDHIHVMLEEVIDQVKISKEDVPVVLVGGGSVLIDRGRQLKGVRECKTIPFFEVANAVGAALSQVSGSFDSVVDLRNTSREDAITEAKASAIEDAVSSGAIRDTVKIVDVMDIPLAYQPQDATRLKVKAVGDLQSLLDDETPLSHGNLIYVTPEDEPAEDEEPSAEPQDPVEGSEEHVLPPTEGVVNTVTGEWQVSEWDLECIAIGAGILGCGGGGNPHIGFLQARKALREGKTIRVITPERLSRQMGDSDVVLPVAFMGAPLILVEKLPSGRETRTTLECHEDLVNIGKYRDGHLGNSGGVGVKQGDGITYIDDYQPVTSTTRDQEITEGGRIVAVTGGEIGGMNSMEPLVVGAHVDLPVLDADGMGRAFPELQMYVPTIMGHPVYPAYLSDEHGRRAVVLTAHSPKHVENLFRTVCVAMGCSAGLCLSPLTKEAITTKMVPHSLSRAWRLGRDVLGARRAHGDPVQAVLDQEGGRLLSTGKVTDVERRTEGGFNRGQLTVEGFGDHSGRVLQVLFQNENLVATERHSDGSTQVLACTPDLISLVTTDSGDPVPTEELRYGLRVSVLVMPAAPQLTTPPALAVVGPQAFGYPDHQVRFTPVGGYVHHKPVPLV